MASLLVTVFFLPITETLISVIDCQQNEKGVLAHSYFPDVQCYVGWHLGHVMISVFFTFCFIMISGVVAYAYFDPEMTSRNRTARSDSRGEVVFIINKVVCQTIFSFMPTGNEWILIVITFFLALALWREYNLQEPYYDQEVGLFYKIVSSYYLYTNLTLFCNLILSPLGFGGGLIAWIVGLPFVALIMLTTKQSKIDTLLRS